MKNNYNIEKIIDALRSKGSTNFLTAKECMQIKGKLSKEEYKTYEPYPEASKVILYKKILPMVKLYKINSKVPLRHQDILGTIFSLGVKEDTFGDIVKYKENFYIFLLPHLTDYFQYNLVEIKKNEIALEEVDIAQAMQFQQKYQEKEYVVSSLRIDNIISTITSDSRKAVLEKFKNKEILLNYDENVKPTRIVRENDIFSIRRYGKYKYAGITKTTKKGGYIIKIQKYE